jgi:hypothetical protein
MPQGGHFIGSQSAPRVDAKTSGSELKPLLVEMHSAALNRAKAEANPALDLLARMAIIKFLRIELGLQFAQILERCRATLKTYEGIRQQKALEYRERVAAFQAHFAKLKKKPWLALGARYLETATVTTSNTNSFSIL